MSLAAASLAGSTRSPSEYELPPARCAALGRLLELQAVDPTASDDGPRPEAAVDRHVADSLVALDLPAVREARGSPTSAPAPAGRAWRSRWRCPAPRVALVESAARHCRYLERAVDGRGPRQRRTSSTRARRSTPARLPRPTTS